MNFVFAAGAWINEIQFLPNIYNNTIEFMKTEASSPYYLDSANSFDSNITIDLNADDTLNGKNILEVAPDLKKTDRYDQYLEVLRTAW